MRNVSAETFITLVTTLVISASLAYSQDNLLLKEDFESGAATPEQWQSGANLPGVSYVYDKKTGKSGQRSLSLQKSANRYFPIAQWFRILSYEGELGGLEIKSQIRAEDATKAILDVSFMDGNGTNLGHEWVAYIGAKNANDPPANHEWKEYSGVVAVPEGTSEVMIALQIYGPGKVWFDDLEATYVAAPAEAAKKPGRPAAKSKKLDNQVEIKIGKETGHYLGVPARSKTVPDEGYGLLLVLPGGDGSADFHPFVSNIAANSMGEDFVLAQPLAKKWTEDQVVVWPTSKLRVKKMGYTTEKLIEAVVEDVGKKVKVDPNRVFLLGWSSGGPAVYAALLKKKSPVTGGLVAMSVFKPKLLPNAANAKGRSIYILHSPDDRVCPYRMAKEGAEALSKAKVRSTLVNYEGGHGWHGNVFGNIRAGLEWLDSSVD